METWLRLVDVRRFFGRLRGVEKVGNPYIEIATRRGLPFYRDPVTQRRYWLQSDLDEFVRANTLESRNSPLRQQPGRKSA